MMVQKATVILSWMVLKVVELMNLLIIGSACYYSALEEVMNRINVKHYIYIEKC